MKSWEGIFPLGVNVNTILQRHIVHGETLQTLLVVELAPKLVSVEGVHPCDELNVDLALARLHNPFPFKCNFLQGLRFSERNQ